MVQITGDLLAERLDAAAQNRAPQPPHPHMHHDRPPIRGHVSYGPRAVPMHLAGQPAAARARDQAAAVAGEPQAGANAAGIGQ